MGADPRIENYLSTLDRALSPLGVGDRAEIVTEIKSHVQQALERDSSQPVDTILAALGEPETVANRYLMERNLKPGKPPISPIVKWLVIGFLGTFAIFAGGIAFLVWHLTPLLEVDSQEEKVSLMGGLIRIDGENIRVAGEEMGVGRTFSGSSEVDLAKGGKLSVVFANGRMAFAPATGSRLLWSCKGSGKVVSNAVKSGTEGQTLDLSGARFLRCEISVPAGAKLSVSGANGAVMLERPRFSAAVNLSNGKVEIEPDRNHSYAYDLSTINGPIDELKSDPDPEFNISVQVGNGKITAD